MSNFKPRKCRECGGTVKLASSPGRMWPYKRLVLPLPADYESPTCDGCGEEWLDRQRADDLDALLSDLYNERVSARSSRAVAVLGRHRSQRALERLLGLSQGYLSKVIAKKKVPSDPLVSQLVSLAKAPEERLQELEEVWGNTPPGWLAEARVKQQQADDDPKAE